MLICNWLINIKRIVRGSLRFRLFMLILLSIFLGTLLIVFSIIAQQDLEVLAVIIVVISLVFVIRVGGDILILRHVNSLVELSKRLSSGDLTARSSPTDSLGLFGELDQSLDRIATSLEEKTGKLQWHNDVSETFSEIVNELAVQHDISTLLQLIVDKMMTLLRASYATISLYDDSRSELEFVAVSGSRIPVGTRIRIGESVIGRTAKTHQPFIVDQYDLWDGRLFEFETDPVTTLVEVPMLYRDELIGVLGVAETGSTRKFDQSEICLMKLGAGAAASVIRNARLFDETHRRLQELEAINAVSTAMRVTQTFDAMLPVLLEKTMNVVNAIVGGIWLYDTAENSLYQATSTGIPPLTMRFKPGEGILGTVFSSAQPYFAPDWREDRLTSISVRSQIPKGLSCAFIPILIEQSTIGVLAVGFHSPHEFLEDQNHLLGTIAEIAGNAIHRVQLHEQTKRQLERLSALHQIDLAVSSSLDTDDIFQILIDRVIATLGVDAACMWVANSKQQTLEFAASRGFRTVALRDAHLHFGEGYAGQVILDQRTIYISDLKACYLNYPGSAAFDEEGFVSYLALPLATNNQVQGVLEIFHRSLLKPNPEWVDFLEALASQAAIVVGYAKLFEDLQNSNIELNLAYDSTLEGWSRALEVRDRETKGHSYRVAEMTLRLAQAMAIPEQELVHIHRGALLHDIGKLGIPDSVLLKPGPLSEEEREILRAHPAIAFKMLTPITYLRPALDIPYSHHEKWNGTGYPRGLKGDEIPLAARIFAIVDVWDALTSDRPYRKAWPVEEVHSYIQEQAGKHFDPQVVDAFFSLLNHEKADGGGDGTKSEASSS